MSILVHIMLFALSVSVTLASSSIRKDAFNRDMPSDRVTYSNGVRKNPLSVEFLNTAVPARMPMEGELPERQTEGRDFVNVNLFGESSNICK